MTEITENTKCTSSRLFWPTPAPTRYLIDPVAFIIALVAAPLLLALPFAVVLFFTWLSGVKPIPPSLVVAIIPIAAVAIGGVPYLIAGGPMFARKLKKTKPAPWVFAMQASLANLTTLMIAAMYFLMIGDDNPIGSALVIFGFGMIFAPVWGAIFAIIYRRLRREFYQNPL